MCKYLKKSNIAQKLFMNLKKCVIINKWTISNIFLHIVGWKMIYRD